MKFAQLEDIFVQSYKFGWEVSILADFRKDFLYALISPLGPYPLKEAYHPYAPIFLDSCYFKGKT